VRLFRPRTSVDLGLLDLLEEAGRNAERASGLLRDMLADYPERTELARDILLCEQEGDRVTHDLMQRLNANGAPIGVERGDAHALAGAIDDVVDHAEETADFLGLYGIEAPMEQAVEMSTVLVGASRALTRAIGSLRGSNDLAGHLVEIHQLENEGDRISRDAIAALFTGHIDPMVVIRWKDVFESLEEAVDACETAAHIIEGIELKRGRGR
jgi:uncharacterized protein Yka (UPF0111/DUF47 family)